MMAYGCSGDHPTASLIKLQRKSECARASPSWQPSRAAQESSQRPLWRILSARGEGLFLAGFAQSCSARTLPAKMQSQTWVPPTPECDQGALRRL